MEGLSLVVLLQVMSHANPELQVLHPILLKIAKQTLIMNNIVILPSQVEGGTISKEPLLNVRMIYLMNH